MARRVFRRVRSALAKPNGAVVRGMELVRAALTSTEPGPTGEEALALCEQRRVEFEADRARQGVLRLGDKRAP